MSKKKKRFKKVQACQEDFTFEVFDEKLQRIQKKLKGGQKIVLKADELLYEVLADCYILSAKFSGEERDTVRKLLEDKCNQEKVKYDVTDIRRTLLKLVYGVQYKKGSSERKKENARIATYARALNNMAGKNIGLDEAKNKLKKFGIDWWANRGKGGEADDSLQNHSSSKNQKPLSEQVLKIFKKYNVCLNSMVVFTKGNEMLGSHDGRLLSFLRKCQKKGKYEFDDINEFGKKEGQ